MKNKEWSLAVLTREEKRKQVLKQIDEMLVDVRNGIKDLVAPALNSGALGDIFWEDNCFLAKALVTIYFDKRPFSFRSESLQEETENLSKFV